MHRNLFFRNVHASELLDIFFVSAISSLLLVRFFLYLTGYPQLGGNGLHIGHMLWGGLCMLVSISLNLAFLGRRLLRVSALIGGIGFGVFIDEIGKFITSDNNYFFRPTIGIIYAIFVILYLIFDFISRRGRLSSREYQLNALLQLEEAILLDMDRSEQRQARQLLLKADQASPLTKHLLELLESVELVPESRPHPLKRVLSKLDQLYVALWQRRQTRVVVRVFFIVQAVVVFLAVVYAVYSNLDDVLDLLSGTITYGTALIIGQLASSIIAGCYVLYGAYWLRESRLVAFESFRRATLINLFLTEFFLFTRIQFQALPGFVFNVVLLLVVGYVMHQERRTAADKLRH